jgi:hypothetical protein
MVGTVDMETQLRKLQPHLEACINSRAADLIATYREAHGQDSFLMPDLVALYQSQELTENTPFWCAIPGMYGGFNLELSSHVRSNNQDYPLVLVAESWCRVVGGSGQRHHITAEGFVLVAEGFV